MITSLKRCPNWILPPDCYIELSSSADPIKVLLDLKLGSNSHTESSVILSFWITRLTRNTRYYLCILLGKLATHANIPCYGTYFSYIDWHFSYWFGNVFYCFQTCVNSKAFLKFADIFGFGKPWICKLCKLRGYPVYTIYDTKTASTSNLFYKVLKIMIPPYLSVL